MWLFLLEMQINEVNEMEIHSWREAILFIQSLKKYDDCKSEYSVFFAVRRLNDLCEIYKCLLKLYERERKPIKCWSVERASTWSIHTNLCAEAGIDGRPFLIPCVI